LTVPLADMKVLDALIGERGIENAHQALERMRKLRILMWVR